VRTILGAVRTILGNVRTILGTEDNIGNCEDNIGNLFPEHMQETFLNFGNTDNAFTVCITCNGILGLQFGIFLS